MQVIAYTDGSALGNPGPGGYGVVLRAGQHYKELAGGFRLTTNNRMELLAVCVALEALKQAGTEIEICTDSQYVQKAVSQGWVFGWEKKGFEGKANPDLWRRFLQVYRRHRVKFRWIRGHSGIPDNERCDVLAKAAAQMPGLPPDAGYVPAPRTA
ncbi:MAG: ribonuclease HI [Bacteroidia bacterium]|nr:ribonuclease HI [Bacteroidia bacterium]